MKKVVLTSSFNQFVILTKKCIMYFKIKSFQKLFEIECNAMNVCLNKMYIIYLNINNELMIFDIHKKIVIGSIVFKKNVSNIKCDDNHVFVCIENTIYMYDLKNLFLTNSVNGCDIIYKEPNLYLYWSDTNLSIQRGAKKQVFKPHINNIQYVCLNNNNNLFATVSKYGTIIRVWSLDGILLNTLRRSFRPTRVTSMVFGENDRWLWVAGASLHVFDLMVVPYLMPHKSVLNIDISSTIATMDYTDCLNIITFDGKFIQYTLQYDPIKIISNDYKKIFYDKNAPEKGNMI